MFIPKYIKTIKLAHRLRTWQIKFDFTLRRQLKVLYRRYKQEGVYSPLRKKVCRVKQIHRWFH